ncbi:heptaprenylglyceryl phosphate synthase [Bacillus marinisedimentorum]|uniref:heptaprenylglyceryl phosphate synthase n=1 Tax=Bacillus marinisedimentorum TaxID=1821260 RepID=UPI0008731061|nr:heptaprenylglyceryl phosphate synthase [Bacillus marinisedimentorum]
MYDVNEWRHVFKIDPNKEISDEDLEAVCESGTDAIIVGGTDGVTLDNTLNMLARVRRYPLPCVLEVSKIESLTPGYDFYFIPTVLNGGKPEWITGLHHEALKEYGEIMNWDEIFVEGYCILNGDAKAARLTDARTDLTLDDIGAYAMMADKLFRMPIFYLEYSGTYGDPEAVQTAKNKLDHARLFYGGGIRTQDQAAEMAAIADTIVVGNIIYEDVQTALKTVKAVKK